MWSPGAGSSMKPETVLPAPDGLGARGAQAELAVRPFERDRIDQQVRADPVADDPPADPAVVDDAEDVVGRTAPQQADGREDVEDVEGVDGMGALGRLRREPAPGRRPDARPEPRLVRAPEVRDRDGVEQVAAEPVGLDDAAVERVGDAVRAGDQLEVRPGALEALGERPDPSEVAAGDGLAEQLVGRIRAAVAEPIRPVRVAREADRPWDVKGDHGSGGDGSPLASGAQREDRDRDDRDGHDGLADDHGRGRQRAVDERGEDGRDRCADDEDARHDARVGSSQGGQPGRRVGGQQGAGPETPRPLAWRSARSGSASVR